MCVGNSDSDRKAGRRRNFILLGFSAEILPLFTHYGAYQVFFWKLLVYYVLLPALFEPD